MSEYKKRKIRFGILGCGAISEAHLQGIAKVKEAELVAVCDVRQELVEEIAEKWGCQGFTSYEEMLEMNNIDVVCICTPSGMHAEQAIMAAQAGKHVVCEKPMAIQLIDVDRIITACAENNVKLTTIFPRRMSPAAQYVKQLITDGRLGKLSLCSGFVKFYRDQAYYDSAGWRGTRDMDGGGAMMNQGIHTIDLLQWLAGPVQSLTGYSANVLRAIEVEDTAVVSLRFRSGALGVIEATTTSYRQPDHRIVIHGEHGTVILTGDEITTLELIGQQVEIPHFPDFQIFPDGHALQISDMTSAILEDRAPIVTGEDGRPALEIILGTYESSRTRREIVF